MKNKVVKIVQQEDKVLHKIAKDFTLSEIKKPETKKLIKTMIETLDSQKDGVGLAGPQIGVSKRIFVVSKNVTSDGKTMVCINPKIVKTSKETKMLEEGCLSVRWVYGEVKRYTKVTLEYLDEDGKKQERGAGGLLSHIFQHEVDHLDGILFIDKAQNLSELTDKEKEDYTKRYDLSV